jgi:hypothetical protein
MLMLLHPKNEADPTINTKSAPELYTQKNYSSEAEEVVTEKYFSALDKSILLEPRIYFLWERNVSFFG